MRILKSVLLGVAILLCVPAAVALMSALTVDPVVTATPEPPQAPAQGQAVPPRIEKDLLGDATNFLIPNLKLKVLFYEGSPLSVDQPPTVDLKVLETEPGIEGATVSNVTKPAKLETGLVVQVPPFIVEGEMIRVDTAEGKYVERVRS